MESVTPASRRSLQFLSYGQRRIAGATAFSFAEVMFAVVILGIGFIMIAAIFPVAMQQSQATTDESIAAAIARDSTNMFTAIGATSSTTVDLSSTATPKTTLPLFPPTVKDHANLPVPPVTNLVAPPAIVVPFAGPRWEVVKNNLILPSDNRFAYVPFYRRENGSNVMQIIVVAIAVRNRSTYESTSDIVPVSAILPGAPAISHTPGTTASANMTVNPDTITIAPGSITGMTPIEGGCITIPPTDPGAPGRTYRLGRQVSAALFELEPADMLSRLAPNGLCGLDGLWGTPDDTVDNPATSAIYSQPTTLQPFVAYATIYNASDSIAGRITLSSSFLIANTCGSGVSNPSFSGGTPGNNVAPLMAAPGAFVIVADDYPYDPAAAAGTPNYTLPLNNPTANPPLVVGSLNGHIFRLGNPVPTNLNANPPVPAGTYDLDPNYGTRLAVAPATLSADLIPNVNAPNSAKGPWARVFIIGAGRNNPKDLNSGFSGAAQDVAVYTTFVPVQ